ncbi:MAG: M23 family metallopeptidase [Flavobacteriales bacterium]
MRFIPFFLALLLICEGASFAQSDSASYHPPLGIDLRLAGNFGELRSNHFHTGLDFKTGGRRGLPIKAIEKGHVSRIKVQEGGYGKVLYIDHPDGNTSVYAHIERFTTPIESFLRKVRYEHERGPIDLYPGEEKLPVEKGETVAWSGNSGSSTAPHLHFEIRNTASEKPIDPLLFDFDIFDRRPPRFHGLKLDWVSGKGYREQKVLSTRKVGSGAYRPSTGERVRIGPSKELRIAVRSTDRATGTNNPLGVRLIKLFIDGELRYSARFDTLDFSKKRYINAHIDHPYLHDEGRTYHRCHVLPHNELQIYGKEGRQTSPFDPVLDSTHKVRIEAYDRAGNRSVLRFELRSQGSGPGSSDDKKEPENTLLCHWDELESYRSKGFEMTLSSGTLYQDHRLTISSDSLTDKRELSPDHRINDASIPLHKAFEARISLDTLPPGMKENLFILSKDDKWGTRTFQAEFRKGWAVGKVKRFGELSVRADSTAPKIRPIRTRNEIPKAKNERFRFHVADNLSGIASYKAYVGEHWCIPYYDVKNSLIRVLVSDSLRSLPTGKKKFLLEVKDRAGNQRRFIKRVKIK